MVGDVALAGSRFGVPGTWQAQESAVSAVRSGILAAVGTFLSRAILTLLLLAGGLYATEANAQTPPTIEARFDSSTIQVGAQTGLTFTINYNSYDRNASFSFVVSSGLTYNDVVTNGCSGRQLTYSNNVFTMTGAEQSGPTCQLYLRFTGTSAGVYQISPGSVSADGPSGSVTGPAGAPVTLTVVAAPAVTTQPANRTVAAGATATFTAAASGTPTPTVQWQGSPNGVSFTNIAGATSVSYTTPATTAADNDKRYRAVFTNSEGTATTAPATLTVVQAPAANGQSVTTAYQTPRVITLTASDPNTPARTVTYTVTAAPAHGTLSGTAPNLTYTPTAGYSGPDSFAFTASNGVATSSPATVSITVQAQPPTITGVAPSSGVAGTSVTITGAGLTGATAVRFDTSPAQSYTVNAAGTQITAVAPVGTPGTMDVSVTTPVGTATRTNGFTLLAPTITVAPAALPNGTVGVAYSQTFMASGGTANYTYALAAGSLPAGMTLGADGTFSGMPIAGGSFTFTIQARDADGFTGTRSYTLTIAAPTIVVTPTALPGGTRNIAYSQALAASGGTAPYSFTLSAGALPAGLTLAANGTLAGTPTTAGSFTFTVRATDSSTGSGPYAGTRSYTLAITAPTITLAPTSLPSATTRIAYSQAVTATGGVAPYTYAVTAGALPSGLTLTSGTISGTPTTAGSFTFTVTASDANGNTGQTGYTLGVTAPAITLAPATLPSSTTGSAYSQTIVASGGTGSYSYAVTGGALPAGVTLTSTGVLSGTATAGGSFTFTITATDGNGNTGTRSYTLAANAPTIAVLPTTLPAATTRVAYSQVLTASGGTAPYSYAVTAGALPAGITLAAGGTLSGTSTVAGSYSFTVTARDSSTGSGPFSGSRSYTLVVGAPAITLAPTTLPDATTRIAYSQTVSASGGVGTYDFAVTAGALPAGLTLTPAGVVSGRATAVGSFAFSLTATDDNGNTGTQSYALAVSAPAITIAPATLPAATTRVSYSQALIASGGASSYGYAVTAGALPAGITLSTGGTLAGTATAEGSFTFTVTATDANGNAGARSYTLAVAAPAIALAPATLPAAQVAQAYAATLSASGGVGPYNFAITAGALPAGVTLSSDGTLAGTPTAGGDFTFTVSVTDANGNGATRSYTLTAAAAEVAVSPTTLPTGQVRVAYSQALAASGGTAPYSYAIIAGALPAGLTLAADGSVSGTPTAGGTFRFAITATDSSTSTGPYNGTQAYTLNVVAPAIALTPAMLPVGSYTTAYSASVTASGGVAPYSYAVTSGALPDGLTLSASGALSGSPTAAGSYDFTVTATDANGNAGLQAYTLGIDQQAQTISFTDPGPKSLSDSPITLAASASTGLPVGFTATTTSVCTVQGISLTLLATGTCTIEVNQSGNTNVAAAAPVSRSFAVTAAPLVTTTAQGAVIGQVGVALTPVTPVTVAGGTQPYGYSLLSGALPAGLSFSTTTGTLSGTPTGGQAATGYTVMVRDGSGQSASATFTLTVTTPTLAIAPTTLPNGAYQAAYSQQLTASGGTQPYRFAVTAGALPSGVTLSASGLVVGTPTAFGRFEVTVTATDSSAGTGPYSATQAFALTIQAPAIPTAADAAETVAYGSSGTVVTPTLGGEVTGLVIVRAPTHGTARVDGRTLVYMPAAGYAGPDSFAYTASNAGGTSAPATVSITVGPAAIAVTPPTLPGAQQDVTYSQQLTATGGAAPYTFLVASGTLPAGLTLSSAGVLSGTPTASGSSSFTVRATDSSTGSGPFAATQAYTLAVALPAAPVVRPVPAVTAAGSSSAASATTRIALSDFVSGNFTALEIAAQPANGVATLSLSGTQTVALYTPRAGFSGSDSFAFVAVGPGGRSAAQTVTLTVTGTAPVAAVLTASAMQGVPVTVDLTAKATGGPFTGATVTAISPANAVTATVVEGGSAAARTYALTLTPALSFSGTASVTYTLSNAFGASTPATVTLAVTSRPDPSNDSVVNGMSAAQAEATRRFARGQIDNFARRNEQLHNGGAGSGGRDMGVSLQLGLSGMMGRATAADAGDVATLKADHARGVLGSELASGAVRIGRDAQGGIPGLPEREVLQAGPGAVTGRGPSGQATGQGAGGNVAGDGTGERQRGSVAIWSGGAVTVGSWNGDTNRAKMTLSTGGLSAGADVKLGDGLIVGMGGGYGADLTKVDGDKARIRGRSWSLAGYGSWSPTDGMFVDGILGAGEVSFDLRRQVAQTGRVATGSRDGSMYFGSLAAGFDRHGRFDLSAYGRVDYLSASLKRFTEVGGGIYGLTYGRRKLDSVASVLGVRAGYPLDGWTPRLRAEWRHEFADADAQAIDYADVDNLRYSTRGDTWLRDAFTLELGAEFTLKSGWSLTTEIGGATGSGATSGTARAGIQGKF